MKVVWCPEASQDIDSLFHSLSRRNDWAGSRLLRVIQMTIASLMSKPATGRPMDDESGRREIFLRFGAGAYVIRYKIVDPTSLAIIRVSHVEEVSD
jgi:plasmid stabilization system protein ParE